MILFIGVRDFIRLTPKLGARLVPPELPTLAARIRADDGTSIGTFSSPFGPDMSVDVAVGLSVSPTTSSSATVYVDNVQVYLTRQ
jgi:hypothetical protein